MNHLLAQDNLNPHLGLLALELSGRANEDHYRKVKINLLSKTRRFDELLKVTKDDKSLNFPTLEKSKYTLM